MSNISYDRYALQYSQTFHLEGLEEADVSLSLGASPAVLATVSGTVTDGTDPIPGATVKLFDDKGVPFQHTLTDENGNYALNQIPSGTYSIAAVAKGYLLSNSVGLTLNNNDTLTLPLVCTPDTTLSLGAIAGVTLTANALGEETPLGNIKLSLLDGSGAVISVTYSADDGEFTFYDVADGIYTLLASAEGYLTTAPITVSVLNGSIANTTVTMLKSAVSYSGTVSGIIRDLAGAPIANCFVGLYRSASEGVRETLIATTKTNNEGKYLFGNVKDGNYLVKAKL